MQYRPMGRTNLKVSTVSLGCWNIGGQWGDVSEADAVAVLRRAYDAGITLFDTADAYGVEMGTTEVLIGNTLRELGFDARDKVTIVSKVGNWGRRFGHPLAYTHPVHIMGCCDASLYRLKTDVIDVYLCHIGDLKDPAIFLEAFDTLKRKGKIRFGGISTNSPEALARFDTRGTCDVLEFDYSLLNRTPEEVLLPYCQEHNIGTIARGVLAMGLLGGKYKETDTFSDEVRKGWNTGPAHEQFVSRVRKVEALKAVSPQDRPLAHTAIEYVLAHPAVHCVIPGAKSPAQVDANVAAGSKALTADEVAKLRAV